MEHLQTKIISGFLIKLLTQKECLTFKKLLLNLFLLLSISLPNQTKAQTTLVAGDLAFSGYVSQQVGTDAFSFVLLVPITSNTVINFTDNGWLSATSMLQTAEQTVTWTSGSSLAAGTEITIAGPSNGAATATLSGGGTNGTCTGTMPSLSTSGDQVLAYQGTSISPTFISGIHMNVYTTTIGDPAPSTNATAWDGTANTFNSSALPPGLTTGTNCIWIGTVDVSTSEEDNGKFLCGSLDLSTAALARAALNNKANWQTEDGGPTIVIPSGCNFLGSMSSPPSFTTNPSNSTICEGTNTSFTIVATGAVSYQWQVNNGGGFANVSNNATYSGATTTTLNITSATNAMNGYLYRCVATNGAGPTNSSSATLTVVPLPVNPTVSVKTPSGVSVADGTPVSATFNAGSGGTGCSDDYRYTTNGGASYLTYTPGNNISTTGLAAGSGFVFIEGRRAGCSSMCQNTYKVLAAWYVTPLPAGATTLNAGDIAFSGYTSTTAGDDFSFVLLRNIGPGTVINFTDNGWNSTTAALQSSEQTITWTSNAAYPAGTEIIISGLTATLAVGGSAGTVTGSAISLSTTGDQILAYRGTAGSPTFISGIHMNVYSTTNGDAVSTTAAAWDGVGTGNATSNCALPPGLTTGTNAIWIGIQDVPTSEFNNARYGDCSFTGTFGPNNTLRSALNNQTNWIKDSSTPPGFTLPTGCLYFGLGAVPTVTMNPSPSTVCDGISTSFSITAGGALSYQWQVDNGGGFTNLTNNTTYTGVNSTTLNINATPFSLNGYLYRCVASNVSGSTPSNSALLTVNAVPVTPTLLTKTPGANNVADGTPVSATFNAGSGGTGCTDNYRYTTDGGSTYLPYTPGNNISTTGLAAGSGWVFIEGRRAGCSSVCQGEYKVLASWYITPIPAMATTLNAGDIAFSSYAASTDEFSFVLLRNIGPGTAINFTTTGWYGAPTNAFRTNEETITWTAPAGGLTAGVEIKISGLTATRSGPGLAGTVTGTALTMITSGDQILAYRGTSGSPTFIAGIHMNVYTTAFGDPASTTAAAWDGSAYASPTVNANASALPTGLTTGVNAIWIGTQDVLNSEYDNAAYGSCSGPGVLGPLTGLRSALNNQGNWVRNDNPSPGFTIPTGCNYLSVLCPSITVTNPMNAAGIAGTSFSETFTSSGGAPTVTYSTVSTLPMGLTLSSAGVLSGIPTQTGTFPIVVTATDGGGCTGSGIAYNLVISLPVVNLSVTANTGTELGLTSITVTATANPAVSGAQTVTLTVTGMGVTTNDYTLNNLTQNTATITIPIGMTTGTATFKINDDLLVEGDETAILTISNPSSGIILGATISQNIVITDNELCGAGGLTFNSQSQINNFASSYAGCVTIGGDLIINDDDGNGNDITNVDGLRQIKSVNGLLGVYLNPLLTSIDSLKNITSISGDISIWENQLIQNVNGLSGITSNLATLSIYDNDGLISLGGLSELTTVNDFNIYNNPLLVNLDSLTSLTTVNGIVYLDNNAVLNDISGLSKVANIGSTLTISNNPSLIEIQPLHFLNQIGGNLIIFNNDALENLDGLFPLSSVTMDVLINDNGALGDYCGLYNLMNEELNNGGTAIGGMVDISSNLTNPGPVQIVNAGQCGDLKNLRTGQRFMSLHDAINDSNTMDGDTISFLDNIEESFIAYHSVVLKGNGFSLTIPNEIVDVQDGHMEIDDNKTLTWLEGNLIVSPDGFIINGGTLHNKGTIVYNNIAGFSNAGVYKGTGDFQGNFLNFGKVSPGN